MKMIFRCFYFLLTALLTVGYFLSMCDFNISTLNLNGARSDFKQAALFKLMETKRIDVMFVQETHSTTDNESDWKRAFKGEVVLSHRSSLSGGVGILFAQSFLPFSFTVDEVIPGVLLKVKTCVFKCLYSH